jgi:GT2 family glycosyltransferase
MPIYHPDRDLLEKIIKKVKSQKFSGKIEIIKVEKGLGLAASMNYGIKKAKSPIVVTLHQDCLPSSNLWLRNLVEPFKEKEVVCSVSKVHLPFDFWNKFDSVAKILSSKEQKIITPAMDEKGCAYKKTVLLKLRLFDDKNYRTAGEDLDMYLKLKKSGKIAYPNAEVLHFHKHTWKNRINKELQLANSQGALTAIHKEMKGRYAGFFKALPILGYPLFIFSINPQKLGISLSILALPLYLLVNLIYSYGFWKGFLMKKQTI